PKLRAPSTSVLSAAVESNVKPCWDSSRSTCVSSPWSVSSEIVSVSERSSYTLMMIRSRLLTATAERYFSFPMLASTVTEEETSWKPVGIVKQYGEPAGEIFEPPQLSVWRPESSGVPEPFGLADAAPGLVAFAAGWPLPATVLAQPASRPHRPSRASAKRLRMRATVSGAWGEPRIPSVPVSGAHISGGAR